MAWQDIDPYKVHKLYNAADFATLKGNLVYLQRPNAATYHHPGTGANYTITGELGIDLDSTNMNLTITTTGGLVKACFYGMFTVASSGDSIRANIVRVDNISHVGRNLFENYAVDIRAFTTVGLQPRGWYQIFPNLPAGSHQFKVIWGVSGGGTGTCFIGYKPRFSVWEM